MNLTPAVARLHAESVNIAEELFKYHDKSTVRRRYSKFYPTTTTTTVTMQHWAQGGIGHHHHHHQSPVLEVGKARHMLISNSSAIIIIDNPILCKLWTRYNMHILYGARPDSVRVAHDSCMSMNVNESTCMLVYRGTCNLSLTWAVIDIRIIVKREQREIHVDGINLGPSFIST